MFRCYICGRPTRGELFCRSCQDLMEGRFAGFESWDHLGREIRRAEELMKQADVGELLRGVEPEFTRLQKTLKAAEPSLDVIRRTAENIELWHGLRQDDISQLRQRLEGALAEVAGIPDLAVFQPSYGELASTVSRARETWETVARDAAAGFAFASLGALTKAISAGPFGPDSVAALRSQLGDWSAVSPGIGTRDRGQRESLYARVGLEPRLGQGRAEVFEAMLVASEVKEREAPPLVPAYAPSDLELHPEYDEERERAAADYRWLYSFESQIRAFIDRILTEAVGERWSTERIPSDVLADCRDRRDAARRSKPPGEAPEHILSYAELGDLSKIICRKDNWPHFKPYFHRQEYVRESFARIIPLRRDIAHCRPLSNDDRLYLHVEIHRFQVAFTTSPDLEG